MEPGRSTATAVAAGARPEAASHEDVISIDLPTESSLPPTSPTPTRTADELPEPLRGMYYTG